MPKTHGHVNLPLGLSDYLKKADADNEYAKKSDLDALTARVAALEQKLNK